MEAERATAEQLLALLEAAVKDRIERKGMNRLDSHNTQPETHNMV